MHPRWRSSGFVAQSAHASPVVHHYPSRRCSAVHIQGKQTSGDDHFAGQPCLVTGITRISSVSECACTPTKLRLVEPVETLAVRLSCLVIADFPVCPLSSTTYHRGVAPSPRGVPPIIAVKLFLCRPVGDARGSGRARGGTTIARHEQRPWMTGGIARTLAPDTPRLVH